MYLNWRSYVHCESQKIPFKRLAVLYFFVAVGNCAFPFFTYHFIGENACIHIPFDLVLRQETGFRSKVCMCVYILYAMLCWASKWESMIERELHSWIFSHSPSICDRSFEMLQPRYKIKHTHEREEESERTHTTETVKFFWFTCSRSLYTCKHEYRYPKPAFTEHLSLRAIYDRIDANEREINAIQPK